MTDPSGVVLARDDGLIAILDAVPVPADWQQQIDTICDLLGAPPPRRETEASEP